MTEKIKPAAVGTPADQVAWGLDQGKHGKLVPIGSKVTKDTYNKLRWLAYMKDSTVSAIVAEYIAAGISHEDFTRYQQPDQ